MSPYNNMITPPTRSQNVALWIHTRSDVYAFLYRQRAKIECLYPACPNWPGPEY